MYLCSVMENKNQQTDRNGRFQLIVATLVTLAGLGLMTAGFIVSPVGEIHSSVLVAFGECLTFSGALMGIDYSYKKGGRV